MKLFHSIKITAFSYENEEGGSVLSAFLRLFPFDLDAVKIAVGKRNAIGFNEKKIEIFEVALEKNSLIIKFLVNLLSSLDNEQKSLILRQAESRLDKNLDFFLRLDKDSWINEEKLVLTDSGRCFHIKISIAAFPKKREVALNIIKEMFKDR